MIKKGIRDKNTAPGPRGDKNITYRKDLEKVLSMMRKGKLEGALPAARDGHARGIELKDPAGTSQLLFILNELQHYDESALRAREFWEKSPVWDETVFANSLCAWVSAGDSFLKDARALLKKYRFDSLDDWRRKFESFEYTPSQITYIFNAALVFHHTKQDTKARSLLTEILGHIVYHIDTTTGGSRDLTDDQVEYFALFLSLIGDSTEFSSLTEDNGFIELHDIIYAE
ncbi:MAG: hypothetical protein CVV44_11285 [Spirochaetae bacterium HGW-Spirochaetae-1]|jgi:hypothetical protein|nr:MAG: hypothetical protein CVV44_11285 [Spirochaetae bacterium HGW-Spirochaetae-1]